MFFNEYGILLPSYMYADRRSREGLHAKMTIKHGGGVGSVIANHPGDSGNSVTVTRLYAGLERLLTAGLESCLVPAGLKG